MGFFFSHFPFYLCQKYRHVLSPSVTSCHLVKIGGVQTYSSIFTYHFTVTAHKSICHWVFSLTEFAKSVSFVFFKNYLVHSALFKTTSK